MNDLVARPHQEAATLVRELLAAYRDHQDLISIGAYRKGANRTVDTAIEMREEIDRFLRQRIEESVSTSDAAAALVQLVERARGRQAAAVASTSSANRSTA